jgi:Fe-S cluster biogenesis protein NfuA
LVFNLETYAVWHLGARAVVARLGIVDCSLAPFFVFRRNGACNVWCELGTWQAASVEIRRVVAEDKDFRERVQRIGGLVQEIEEIADPALHASVKELVQSLMDIHGAALERALEIVSAAGEPGMNLIDQLGRDPTVSSMLILYGLHPEELDSRVLKAIERVKPQLHKQGCEVELLGLSDGVVRLRVQTGEHTCGSTAKTAQAILEGAIYDAAPDIVSLTIEGLDGKAASGFVALDKLIGVAAGPQVPTDAPLRSEAAD